MDSKLTVVIPCWKEDLENALSIVEGLLPYFGVEWIIAMACPPVGWEERVSRVNGDMLRVVECAEIGRGNQMNEGAALAHGEMLLFHHCDTDLTPAHMDSLFLFTEKGGEAGAFHRALDERHGSLKCLDPLVRWFNQRWGNLLGDQSVFIRRELFEKIGGFKPFKLMEDVEFSQRLRRSMKVTLIDPPINSSDRRRRRFGSWWQVSLSNMGMLLLFSMGVHPDKLHKFYYKNWNIKNT